MGYVYVGDYGTEIRLNCVSDISTAGSPTIAVRKPDGTEVSWPAVREGNTLVYLASDGDLDMPGIYKLQAVPDLPTWKGRGRTCELMVFNKFNLV